MMDFMFGAVTGVLAGIGLAAWAKGGKNTGPLDDTDDHATGTRSKMRVLIDHGTGCQYLLSEGGGLTPRLYASGKHICVPKGGANASGL